MFRYLSKSIVLLLFSVIILCVIYPGAVWVIGQVFFPFQANGSLVKAPDGTVVGSRLIAQPFTKENTFSRDPRPPPTTRLPRLPRPTRPQTTSYATALLAPSDPLSNIRAGRKPGSWLLPTSRLGFSKINSKAAPTSWLSGPTCTTRWLKPGLPGIRPMAPMWTPGQKPIRT